MAYKQGEIGGVGRSNSALFQYNLSTDEYLNTLKWPNDIKIYDKMSRSDAQVKAMLLLLELPIRSTMWFIKPYDESSKAKEISDFINNNLFKKIGFSFDELLKNICTMFAFGHSIFEKVFEVRNGYLEWKKIAVRPQSTIYDWMYDEVGDIKSIQQYNLSQGWTIVEIPIEKLLIFTHDMQQGDYRGRSALRSAYKHWSIKDFLYKITNIGIERNFVGTPTMTLPPNSDNDDIEESKKIVNSLRSNEVGGVTLPDGFVLGMFEGKRTLMDVLPYIQYHDTLISRSVLAQFINLGSGTTGSFALGESQIDLFLMLLNASAKYIASIINTHAIPELVKYNFDSDLYPKLCFKELGGEEKLLSTLKTMVDGSIVVPDEDLENYIREMLDLPEKKELEKQQQQGELSIIKGQQKQEQEDITNENYKPNELVSDSTNNLKVEDGLNTDQEYNSYVDSNDLTSSADNKKGRENKKPCIKCGKVIPREGNICSACLRKYSRNVRLDENISSDQLKNINDVFDKYENEFAKYAKPIIVKQLVDLSEKVRAEKLENIATIPVRYKGELTQFFSELFVKAADDGAIHAANELNVNKNNIDTTVLKAQAALIANAMSERLKTQFLTEYMTSLSMTNNSEKSARNVLKMLLGDGNG